MPHRGLVDELVHRTLPSSEQRFGSTELGGPDQHTERVGGAGTLDLGPHVGLAGRIAPAMQPPRPGLSSAERSAIDRGSRKDVRQNAVRPGNAVGELPVEGEGQIREASLTHRGGEPHPLLGGLALVVGLH